MAKVALVVTVRLPGESVPPAAMVTGPAIAPVPVRAAPALTVTAPFPNRDPSTSSVPLLTVVEPE